MRRHVISGAQSLIQLGLNGEMFFKISTAPPSWIQRPGARQDKRDHRTDFSRLTIDICPIKDIL